MMRATILALCLVACAAGNLRSRTQVKADHPVVGVIKVLKTLGETAKGEGQTEEVAYTKFEYWCKTSKTALNADISKRSANIDSLGDTIKAKTGEKTSLETKIAELDDEITALGKSKTQATGIRSAANTLFKTTDKDLEDTIKACADCIVALEGAYNKTEGAALLEMQRAQRQVANLVGLLEVKATAEELNTIQGFLKNSKNETDPVKALGDYEKHIDVYKFKSDSVIELLKDLKEKFEEEKLAGVKAETNSLNAFTLQVKELDNSVAAAEASKTEKNAILGDVKTALNEATTEKGLEEEAVAASEGTLKTTTQECTLKANEWQERSEIRKSEIAAIESAIDILSKVTGVRTEAPSNPTLPSTGLTLLQLGAGPKDAKAKAIQLLRAAAKNTHSRALERLAMAISSKSLGIHYNKPGAFDEIIIMIQKMIYKLQADQTSEDKHKAWCDKELEKTTNSISDKSDKVSELGSKITALKATESSLTEKIAEDTRLIQELTAKMKEMTEIREVGKKENAIAVKDAEDAITAISEATAVIIQFYKSSGAIAKNPWESFVQADPAVELPEKPTLWSSSYTAVTDPTKQPEGIVAVLDTAAQKFSQMVADTKAQEATDQETFNNEKKAATIEMARLRQESEEFSEQKRRTNTNIQSEEDTKKHVQKELDAWNQYDTDLKPACVDGDATYDERKASRNEEIAALREAETILKTAFDDIGSASSFLMNKIRRHVF